MGRPSSKSFEFGKGIYYFNIRKGFGNVITIKRKSKQNAIDAFKTYHRNAQNCEWLGKWDGKKFIESSLDALGE